ncbi:MAG: Uma2 family endonuclease [Oscillospiraceae bacterium]|nr:Uma2 family endonuclease [Oscillospiraceae bacterium]
MQEYNREILIDESQRYEIHDGKIYYMAGASTGHGNATGNIFNIFKNFLKGKKCRVFNESVNVTFKNNFRQFLPDVKIVCDPNKIKDDGIHGAPDLIVEVISKSTAKYDRGYKLKVYELYRVKEYWIIDINSKNIEVYLLKENRLELDNIYHHYSDEEIKTAGEYAECELEVPAVKAEIELIKIKTMKTFLFGNDLIINIADIFENIN